MLAGDRRGDQSCVVESREFDQRYTVEEVAHGCLRNSHRQSRFAHAAGTGQRQQSHPRTTLLQQLACCIYVLIATDQACG